MGNTMKMESFESPGGSLSLLPAPPTVWRAALGGLVFYTVLGRRYGILILRSGGSLPNLICQHSRRTAQPDTFTQEVNGQVKITGKCVDCPKPAEVGLNGRLLCLGCYSKEMASIGSLTRDIRQDLRGKQ